MEIAILGFGPVAKEVVRQLKELSIYGEVLRVYCVHTKRNSMSYGPDSVVEIIDRHGDGLRTYNDGDQATRLNVAVSSFEGWLIEQSKVTIDAVVDCTSYNEDSKSLVFSLLEAAKADSLFVLPSKELVQKHWKEIVDVVKSRDDAIQVSFNPIPSGDPSQYSQLDLTDKTIHEYIEKEDQDLFVYRNGGPYETAKIIVEDIKKAFGPTHEGEIIDWTPVIRSESENIAARKAADEAAQAMKARLVERRVEGIQENYVFDESGVGFAREVFSEEDIDTFTRFVINGEGDYKSSSYYDHKHKRLIVSHEMLDWFFAEHMMLDVACTVLKEPYLVVTNAKYIKYDSPESYISEHLTKAPCTRTLLHSIAQKEPWTLYLGGRRFKTLETRGPFIHSDRVTVEASPLGETGNDYVGHMEIHFGTPDSDGRIEPCTCFEEE
jgi:hypothetical protein